MCYHVATGTIIDIKKTYSLEDISIEDYTPMYHSNGYDHDDLPVMTIDEPHKIQPVTWGLVPHYTKGTAEADKVRNMSLNARSETLFTTPMFRDSAKNRCLVFVKGFFEWKHEGKEKTPHFIYMPDQRIFTLGGVYSIWRNPETGDRYRGLSIVTTDANELMADIHNSKKRMPLVLGEYLWSTWLNPDAGREDIQAIMKPYHDGELQTHEISKLITSRTKDSNVPEVQLPVKGQSTLF